MNLLSKSTSLLLLSCIRPLAAAAMSTAALSNKHISVTVFSDLAWPVSPFASNHYVFAYVGVGYGLRLCLCHPHIIISRVSCSDLLEIIFCSGVMWGKRSWMLLSRASRHQLLLLPSVWNGRWVQSVHCYQHMKWPSHHHHDILLNTIISYTALHDRPWH